MVSGIAVGTEMLKVFEAVLLCHPNTVEGPGIVSAGEKVDVSYETENNVNIKRLAGGNGGNLL